MASRQRTSRTKAARQTHTTQTATETRAETTTLTAITQQQSVEIVQTAVHASLSALAYLRFWFSESAFAEQIYENGEHHWSYDDYISGKTQLPAHATTNGRTVMRVLRRDKSEHANIFLNWLEKGIFEALKLGYLRALHVSLFQDPEQKTKVFELYTFSFTYLNPDADSEARRISSVQLNSPGNKQVNIKDARWMMQRFVREVQIHTQTMEDMPPNAYLQMHIEYNENRPAGYEPPFFSESTDSLTILPEPGFTEATINMKGTSSGHHTMSLKLSHIVPTDDVEPGVAESKENSEEWSAQRSTQVSSQAPLRPSPMPRSRSNRSCRSNNLSSSSGVPGLPRNEQIQMPSTPTREKPRGAPMVSSDSATLSPDTHDLQELARLQNMMLPPSAFSQPHDTQVITGATQGSNINMAKVRLRLAETTINRLDRQRSIQLAPRKAVSAVQRPSVYETDKVHCACGATTVEDDMIYCSWCDKFQHAHCYGYRGCKDAQGIPEPHACYHCLLQGKEEDTFRVLRALALHRRTIHVLQTKGYGSDKELMDSVGCGDARSIKNFIAPLKRKGYLVAPARANRAKEKRWTFTRSADKLDPMNAEYFNALFKIAHYFGPSRGTMPLSSSAPSPQGEARYPLRARKEGRRRSHEEDEDEDVMALDEPVSGEKRQLEHANIVGGRKKAKISQSRYIEIAREDAGTSTQA